jgi:MFS family permease
LVQDQLAASDDAASPPTRESRNPFAIPDYRGWWTASLVSSLGLGIAVVAVPLFIRDRVAEEDRALAIAAALIAQSLPGALLTLAGGVIADRVDRRRIPMVAFAVAAGVAAVYVALSLLDIQQVWPILVLAAISGASMGIANPARQSMVPQIVQGARLQNGIILGNVVFMASMQMGGPAIGGMLADGPGITIAFAVQGALLLFGATLFSRLRSYPLPPPQGSVRSDLVNGLRYARNSPQIVGLLVIALLPGVFFGGPMMVNMVIMVEDVLVAPDRYVGLLFGVFGAGILVFSILLTIRPLPRRGLVLSCAPLQGGIVFTLFGLNESLPLAFVLMFFFGAGAAIFINLAITLLQETTEAAMMGRVMSMYSLAFMGSAPIGFAWAGVTSSLWGPQVSIVLSGSTIGVLGVLLLVWNRHLRAMP